MDDFPARRHRAAGELFPQPAVLCTSGVEFLPEPFILTGQADDGLDAGEVDAFFLRQALDFPEGGHVPRV